MTLSNKQNSAVNHLLYVDYCRPSTGPATGGQASKIFSLYIGLVRDISQLIC